MGEPTFVPQPGQVDYTNIRYAPCIKVIPLHKGKILLAKRTPERRLYPSYWDVVNGFLDDNKSIEEKAAEELEEEVSMKPQDIVSIRRGAVMISEDPSYNKTWIIVPVLVEVKTAAFKLDWEAVEAAWVTPQEMMTMRLIPGSTEAISQFFPELL